MYGNKTIHVYQVSAHQVSAQVIITMPVASHPIAPGKPVFGTLIALLYKGRPVLGIIDQPILKERWLGVDGKPTTLNGVSFLWGVVGGCCLWTHVCVAGCAMNIQPQYK